MKTILITTILFIISCGNPISCSTITPIKVVGLGDSTMHGTGEDLGLPNHNYAEYIALDLGATLDNRAIRGASIQDMIGQINSKPISPNDIVIFQPGINDASRNNPIEGYKDQLKQALDLLATTKAKIYVGSIQRTPRIPDTTSQLFVDALDQVLASNNYTNVIRVPVFESILANPATMQDTCCHPNYWGHKLIAQVYLNVIKTPNDYHFIKDN